MHTWPDLVIPRTSAVEELSRVGYASFRGPHEFEMRHGESWRVFMRVQECLFSTVLFRSQGKHLGSCVLHIQFLAVMGSQNGQCRCQLREGIVKARFCAAWAVAYVCVG